MVLIRWFSVLGLALVGAGCNQSLFDAHGGGPGGDAALPGGPTSPPPCPGPCIADAAVDFDGTAHGASGRWRYVDDRRDQTWAVMPGSTVLSGIDENSITSCKLTSGPGAAACSVLPGALLITSSGATSTADPAIEFTVPTTQVAQIALRAYVPSGNDQQILLYRNSRPDALFTGTATAGKLLDQTITVDALAGDRFLLAVSPRAKGAANVGIYLSASGTGARFPQSCQLALEFDGAAGSSLKELCNGASFDSRSVDSTTGTETVAALDPMDGPFLGASQGISLPPGRYLQGQSTHVLEQSGDLTVQLWMLQNNQDTVDSSWPFSDLDLDSGGGLGMAVFLDPGPVLDATTALDPGPPPVFSDTIAAIGGMHTWQFVRVVHAGGMLNVCVDGKSVASKAVPVGQLRTTQPPYIGRNVRWSPVGAFFDGIIADVRVFTGALPCPPPP